MIKIPFRNCMLASCVTGCLAVVVILLLASGYLYKLLKEPNITDNAVDTHDYTQLKEKSLDKGEPILVLALISDTESDFAATERALAQIKKAGVENVIHLGDITSLGTKEGLLRMKAVFDESGLVVISVPGDRDLWKSSGLDNYNEVFGKSYQQLVINDVKFLLIDNSNEYEGIDLEQMSFIENELVESHFVLLHNPVFFGNPLLGRQGMGQYSVEVDDQRVTLLQMVVQSDVKAVFAGDQHVFYVSADPGRSTLRHYVVPALNDDKSLGASYLLLYVYEDGDYAVEKIKV